jgi:hypothetical protein
MLCFQSVHFVGMFKHITGVVCDILYRISHIFFFFGEYSQVFFRFVFFPPSLSSTNLHTLYGYNIKPKYLMDMHIKIATQCPLRRLTDFSRVFIILLLKKTVSDNLWTCQSTGWQATFLHDTHCFQASEQNLYILSENFRGSFLSFQADAELIINYKTKAYFCIF